MLVIPGDHPVGEAADWVNVEDIAMEQQQNLPPESVLQYEQLPVFSMHEHFQEPWENIHVAKMH